MTGPPDSLYMSCQSGGEEGEGDGKEDDELKLCADSHLVPMPALSDDDGTTFDFMDAKSFSKTYDTDLDSIDLEVEMEKHRHFWRACFLIGLSFVISIGINLYNTFVFSQRRYNLGLPLFSAAIYDWTQLFLACLSLMIVEWRSGPGVIGSFKLLSRRQLTHFILPCGIAAATNIALSNSSLRYVSLSFYTMVKSCSPVFVLMFAFAFQLEKPTPTLLLIMALIGLGIVLTVWDAVRFSMIGFILVFCATIVSGLRWTLTQLLIESSEVEDYEENTAISTPSPLRTMLYLAPIIGAMLSIFSLTVEGPRAILSSEFFHDLPSAMTSFGLCMIGGMATFVLIVLEYKVLQEFSVLTFSIAGIFKEIIIICLSVMIFGDQLKLVNILGVSVSIFGILLYNFYRVSHRDGQVDVQEKKRRRAAGEAMKNMFMSVPTTEPSWMIDPYNDDSNDSIDSGHFWSFAPSPSPVQHTPRHKCHRSVTSWRDFKRQMDSFSVRSTRTTLPRKSSDDERRQQV